MLFYYFLPIPPVFNYPSFSCVISGVSVFIFNIFDTDFWSTSQPVSSEFASLMEKLKFTALASRASGTSLNYTRVFNRWRSFVADVLGISAFPVEPIHCALFLQYLLDSSKSVSSINCAFYAFKWLHDLAGVPSPTIHPTVVAVKEGAVRLASSPVKHRKEPLEAEHLRRLVEKTDMNDLLQLRNLVMFVLAFSGFLRFSELSLIRAKDITFNVGFISVFIEKSKADQLREGQSVVIAETGTNTCPVALLKLYMNSSQLSFDSDEYLFRPISASGYCKRLISVNRPLVIPPTGSLSRNHFVALCRTFLSSVLILPGLAVLPQLQTLVSLIEISNVMAVGPQSLPRILI